MKDKKGCFALKKAVLVAMWFIHKLNRTNRFHLSLNYEKTAIFIVKSGSFASGKGADLLGETDG
ncbi:MAG TPA: hypothetical protein VN963_01785 [bacterium]|nr:hypothetical protein [bacterium]